MSELPDHRLKEIKRFFTDYKSNEHKLVTVEEIKGRDVALQVVKEAMKAYADYIRGKLFE